MLPGTLVKWTGLVASVLCTMFSGIFLAFNVYAVQLKAKLDLSQTQGGCPESRDLKCMIDGHVLRWYTNRQWPRVGWNPFHPGYTADETFVLCRKRLITEKIFLLRRKPRHD